MTERERMLAVTNRTITALRADGFEVIDARGQTPQNDNPVLRYGPLRRGLADVRYLLMHWTGDRFRAAFFDQLGIPDDGRDGIIDATLTPGQERKLIHWYAEYHIGRDGGTWGGIAYGMLVMPSGRIWVLWDIGTLTYHAFAANAQSYAVCAPVSQNAPPTAQQARAVRGVMSVLTDKARFPEFPATPADVWGHGEATFLDSRNVTSCPGTLLPLVREFRAGRGAGGGKPMETGDITFEQRPWVIQGGFAATWRALGDRAVPLLGYPQSNEFSAEVDGVMRTVQLFERGVLGWYPVGTKDGVGPEHPFHIRVLTLPEAVAVLAQQAA